jgi:hypothetical protein
MFTGGGDELAGAGERVKARVGRDARQLTQEVRDVGLIPRPVAAEHVRIDNDHSSSS